MKKSVVKFLKNFLLLAKARPYYFGAIVATVVVALVGTGFALHDSPTKNEVETTSKSSSTITPLQTGNEVVSQPSGQATENTNPQPTTNISTPTPKATGSTTPKTTAPEPAKSLVFNKSSFVIKAGEDVHDVLTVRASNGEAISMPMGNSGPVSIVYRTSSHEKKNEWTVGLNSNGFNPTSGTYTLPVRASGSNGSISGTITVQVVASPSFRIVASQPGGPGPTMQWLYVKIESEGGYTGTPLSPTISAKTPGISCSLSGQSGSQRNYLCYVPAPGNYEVAIRVSDGTVTREILYTVRY